uniref:Uncharacterized protein n=1 Tax=Moniliophthora roreri TaxID=221103 RepID=A0A0W0F8X9_MONRR
MSVFYGAAYYTHLLTEQEPYDVMYKRVLCDDTRKASKMYKQLGTLTAILPYIILATASVCPGQVDLGESTIGANNEVKVGFATCPDTSPELLAARDTFLDTRQTPPANVCGAPCNTNCFTPAGGGPDPNDCHVIADALLFAFQNTGRKPDNFANTECRPVLHQLRSSSWALAQVSPDIIDSSMLIILYEDQQYDRHDLPQLPNLLRQSGNQC